MTIPPAFLDELRARVPLSDIVGRRIRLQRAGREWKAPCPFHAEKTPSFYVNDQKSFFHCFGCGAHGDAVGFLMRHDGLAFPEAVEQLAGLAGMEVPKPEPEEHRKYDRLKALADALEAACKWFEAQLHASAGREALRYLEGRGLDERTIAEFRLGYAPTGSDALRAALTAQGHAEDVLEELGLIRRPDDGRAPYGFFRNRVMFPVSDKRGRIIAFGGRILDGEGPKYVNSPEHALFHKGAVLYGLARARAAIAQGARPVVVEGYMDVIAMQRAGFGGAVAPLGTALTEAQLGELWKAQDEKAAVERPPILCFDGDAAGLRAASRAIERILPLLGPARTVEVGLLPPGDDPDSLVRKGGPGEVSRTLEGALPLVGAIWEFAVAGRRLETPEQRAALKADLDAQAALIADRTVQALYRSELRGRFDRAYPVFRRGAARDRSPGAVPGPRPPAARRDAAIEARLLVSLMVSYPGLFEEKGEEFARVEMPQSLEPLRQAILRILASETLDAEGLCVHLRSLGHGAALDQTIGRLVGRHGRPIHPDRPVEKVRRQWEEALEGLNRRLLDQELAAARADQTGVDRTLELMALGNERRSVGGTGEESGPLADDPGREADFLRFTEEVLARNPVKGHRQADPSGNELDRID